jgi:hypothetical protein
MLRKYEDILQIPFNLTQPITPTVTGWIQSVTENVYPNIT